MRTLPAGILITITVLALAVQLALPSYLEDRVEDRLEEGGGTARVSLTAVPALTLVAGRGGSFEASGTGPRLDLGERRENPFRHLDGFKRVDMDLRDLELGPLRIERFRLLRGRRDESYDLTLLGTTTPRGLATELGGATAGSLGGLVGALASGIFPGAGDLAIPVELDARVESRNGEPRVTGARGSVAGVPAGPLAEIVLAAVLERL